MRTDGPLPPGSTLGILGGGQLGRMLALAASRLGIRTHIYAPEPDSPAFDVTPFQTRAAYDDERALAGFAAAVDVITYEFENVPATTAAFLAKRRVLRPGARALAIAQDRLAEKQFLSRIGIPVAPYRSVTVLSELGPALEAIGLPAVLKTTRMGYDGKGQRRIDTKNEAATAFDLLAPKPLVIEAFVPFACEISVVAARSGAGDVACFDAARNLHRDGILRSSSVPAGVSASIAREAALQARRIAEALDYVGVLGVEFFVREDGSLLVNEIAPRVHNSGHWTEAVCVTDQFEQHVRAVLGWPLGDPSRLADVVMENLIGDELGAVPNGLAPGVRPHLYGKREPRPGRKMGHLNRIGSPAD